MRRLALLIGAIAGACGSPSGGPDPDPVASCGDAIHEGDATIDAVLLLGDLTTATWIRGDLFIAIEDGDVMADGELALRCVDGDVWIVSTSLTSLAGLENLHTIGGDLVVRDNLSLVDTSALSALTTVGGGLEYSALAPAADVPLTDLSGLNSLESIGGDVQIDGAPDTNDDLLTSLSSVGGGISVAYPGMNALESIGGGLVLQPENAQGPSYTALRTVGGSISVGPGTGAIPALDALESVDGMIVLGGSTLTTVSGFGSLATVGHAVYLSAIDGLETIDGFAELIAIGGNPISPGSTPGLFISGGSGNVTEISGFGKLETVVGHVVIENIDAVEITGLASLREIEGRLRIEFNPNLRSLDAFSSLERVLEDPDAVGGEAIDIIGNDALDNLGGLSSLVEVEGKLEVRANAQLVSLRGTAGLDRLERLTGLLEVWQNPSLIELGLLPSATSIYGFRFSDNASLSACEMFDLYGSLVDNMVGLQDVSIGYYDDAEECAPAWYCEGRTGYPCN